MRHVLFKLVKVVAVVAGVAAVLLWLTGCNGLTPVQPGGAQGAGAADAEAGRSVGAVTRAKPGFVLTVAVERTGKPEVDAQFIAAAENLLRRLNMERAGEKDKILLADVNAGGVVSALGPKAFKARYGKEGALREALQAPSGPSRVYDVLTQVLDDTQQYLGAKTRATLVVFSPMVDKASKPRGINYLLGSLVEFHKSGTIAFYGVDPAAARELRPSLEKFLREHHLSSAYEANDLELPRFGEDADD